MREARPVCRGVRDASAAGTGVMFFQEEEIERHILKTKRERE